jgi:hypothetical protein
MNEWHNDTCKGYAILAAKAIRLKGTDIQRLLIQMERIMEGNTLQEAMQAYIDSNC